MRLILDTLGYVFIFAFALSWIDTLWIFGVENSKDYTMWKLIQIMGQL